MLMVARTLETKIDDTIAELVGILSYHLLQLFVQSVVVFRHPLQILSPTKQFALTVIWISRYMNRHVMSQEALEDKMIYYLLEDFPY